MRPYDRNLKQLVVELENRTTSSHINIDKIRDDHYVVDDHSQAKQLNFAPNDNSLTKYTCKKDSKIYLKQEVENSYFKVVVDGYTGYMTLDNLKKINKK